MEFFTSDTHFGHRNIIEYCERPFLDKDGKSDVGYMNKVLIDNINEICTVNDTLYHLGDFCFVGSATNLAGNSRYEANYYLSQIKPKVVIIKGNHDSRKTTHSIIHDMTIKAGGKWWFCQHEPYPKMDYNLAGHVHGLWRVVKMGHKYIVNVGVDVWDYKPISINQVMEAIENHRHFFNNSEGGKAPRVNR